MQGWWTPVGSRPESTYWMRRGLVLLTLVLVVAAVVRGCTAVGESRPTTSATPSVQAAATVPSPSPTAQTSDLTTPTPSAVAPSVPALVPGPTPTPTPVPVCDPAKMRVTLVGTREVKTPGSQKLDMSVINGTGGRCQITIDQKSVDLTISSGGQTVWTTKHCPTWIPPATVTLDPEAAKAWQVAWPTRLSAAGCKITSDTLPPGTYVATLGLTGGPAPTNLVMELQRG